MRMWFIAIGAAIIGSFGLVACGILDPGQSDCLGLRFNPVASVLGGLVFGQGMALAGNCGLGALAVQSHSFAAPIGDRLLWVMTASGTSLSPGAGSVAGVLTGAFAGPLIKGHFRWEACEDPRELRRQILGGALMGIGAVVAVGCTIGQAISAFSLLAWSAPLTLEAIMAGCALGLRQLIEGFAPAQ